MPGFYIEGNTPKPGDDELRLLHKWADLLFVPGVSPDILRVSPGDDEERTLKKINQLLVG